MEWSPEKSHKMSGKVDFSQSRNTEVGPREQRLGNAWQARWGLLRPALAGAGAAPSPWLAAGLVFHRKKTH